jgi:autotransporter-associated beta strand protein
MRNGGLSPDGFCAHEFRHALLINPLGKSGVFIPSTSRRFLLSPHTTIMNLPHRLARAVFLPKPFVVFPCVVAVAALSATPVLAADLTWDNSASAGVQSTAGTWNNQSNSNWTADGGTSNVQWNNANLDNAIFTTTGSAYVVTVATITANDISFSGAGAGTVSLNSSTLTFGGTLTVASGNAVSIGAQLSGAGSIVSAGTLTLSGTTNNFTGGVTLNTGSVLNLAGSSLGSDVLGTGTLTLNGGTISTNLFTSETSITNAIVFGGNFTFNNSNGGYSGTVDLGGATRTITSSGTNGVGFSGVITNGGIIAAGTKGITLSNVANTFAGGVTISAGSALTYNGNSYSGTAGAVTAGSMGTGSLTIEEGATFTTTATAKAGNNVVVNGNFSLNTNNMTFEGGVDLGAVNRTITILSTNGVTFSGKVSGTGGIILAGTTGSFGLTNVNNDFSGGVTLGVNNSLSISGASTGTPGAVTKGPLGTGTLTINGGRITTSYVGTGANIYNNVVVAGDFSITPDSASFFYGGWDLGTGIRTVNVNSSFSAKTLLLSNVVSGTGGGFTFTTSANGAYTSSVIFSGSSSNTYTGLTTMNGTTAGANLRLDKSSGATSIAGDLLITSGEVRYVANGNQIADSSAVTVNGASALFNLTANRSDTVGTVTLDGGGSITGTGTSALTSTGTFEMKSGSVTAILAGSGIALNKTTAGTVTLSGANTFTGATTVDAGTLALGSTGSLASTSYSIASGATFDASAKTSYSLAAVGTTIGIGATTSGFFNGPTGALTIGNSLTLNFSTSLIADGQTYNLFDFGSKTGDFSSVGLTGSIVGSLLLTGTDTWTGLAGGYSFTFNQATGNLLVTSSAVPEPSTYALLLGGMAMTAVLIQRRRR